MSPTNDISLSADDITPQHPEVEIRQAFTVTPFDPRNCFSLPIIITSFNRLTCLRQLVECLRSRGYWNLYVIDNASDYEPLLRYYIEASLPVFSLSKNVGCYALWQTTVGQLFTSTYYALTDPDVVPISECPDDFAAYFLRILDYYPNVNKVGFGLRLDDIPRTQPLWSKIVRHELQFWKYPLAPNLYAAPIDTTFA